MKRINSPVFLTAIAAFLIVIGLSGCVIISFDDLNSVTAKGDPENYEFKVGEYNAIKAEGFCDIRYYNGRSAAGASPGTVILSLPPNVREYYRVEVINGELVVSTTKRISYHSNNSPVLTVSTPVLNRLVIDGAGAFTAYDKITASSLTIIIRGAGSSKAELEVDSLYAELSGAGNMELSGRADTVDINISGIGELDALALETRETVINLSGTGHVGVNCSQNLRINADGMGAIEYRGAPNISINKTGMVSIKQLN